MIFGFNSEVTQDGTVYHVQSEVRQHERRLQTQIFVRGRCLGKRSIPLVSEGEPPEQEIQEMLKTQHRQVLDAIREGRLDALLAEPPLKLECLSAEAKLQQRVLALRFHVSPVPACLLVQLEVPGGRSVQAQADAAPDGIVEFQMPLADVPPDAGIVVQMKSGTRSTTQQFRLRQK